MHTDLVHYGAADVIIHTAKRSDGRTIIQLMNDTTRRVLPDYPADASGCVIFSGSDDEQSAALEVFFERIDALGLLSQPT
jgi:hypothetical protein